MFEDIKLFRCWKLYLLKINKPSRWERAKMVTISDGGLWDRCGWRGWKTREKNTE